MAEGGSWIAKYGLPSVIVSLALFGLQQQQQTFDRLQASIVGGWQFYSQNRSPLLHATDYERELSTLDVIGRAFPSVYCDVRLDMNTRAGKAQPRDGEASGPEGQAPMSLEVLTQLRDKINLNDTPYARQLPENAFEAWMPRPKTGKKCDALPAPEVADAGASTGAAAPAAEESRASEPTAAPPPPAPGAPAATGGVRARDVLARGEQASSQVAARTAAPTAPRNLRLFIHVVAGGPHESELLGIMNNATPALTNGNFRVIRGIARIPQQRFARDPVVRYFGPDEKEAAEQLAAYLTYLYRAQNLQFHASAIGDRYPAMPHDNIEVWIPNPR